MAICPELSPDTSIVMVKLASSSSRLAASCDARALALSSSVLFRLRLADGPSSLPTALWTRKSTSAPPIVHVISSNLAKRSASSDVPGMQGEVAKGVQLSKRQVEWAGEACGSRVSGSDLRPWEAQ
eukprot:scaffold6522_cov105-Pinguiococcus_pyrenoidosus.AAC.1